MKLLALCAFLSALSAFCIVSCTNKPEDTPEPAGETVPTGESTPADETDAAKAQTAEQTEAAKAEAEKQAEEAKKAAEAEWAAAALRDPRKANLTAPDVFKAKFETSKGDFVIEVRREWSPNGADRFYNLVKAGFYDGVRFFRVIEGFMAQFGMNGDPAVSAVWSGDRRVNELWEAATIPDDPVKKSNTRGYVTFAKTQAPNSRTTQVFINYADGNSFLDPMGFSPFGIVLNDGMAVVDSLYSGYGDAPPKGRGPNQRLIQAQGNEYLENSFPKLDYVKRATIVE